MYFGHVVQIWGAVMSKLSDTIDARLKKLGIPGSKMCDDLGMSRSTLTELRKGRATTLKAEKAAAIAFYLGLTVEELLGKEKTPINSSEQDTGLSQAFFRLKQGLEPYDLSEADVDFLLEVYKAHIKKNQ